MKAFELERPRVPPWQERDSPPGDPILPRLGLDQAQ